MDPMEPPTHSFSLDPSQQSLLDQNTEIPMSTDQHIPTLDPSIFYQDDPSIFYQDDTLFLDETDLDIPFLNLELDQDITPSHTLNLDQNIEIPMPPAQHIPIPNPNPDIPNPNLEIPDQNIPTLLTMPPAQHIPIPNPNPQFPNPNPQTPNPNPEIPNIIDQNIPTLLTMPPAQHIPNPNPQNHNIIDQNIQTLTVPPAQYFPNHNPHIPIVVSVDAFIPSADEEMIPSNTLVLDQNIPTLVTQDHLDQNIFDADFSTLISKLDEDIFAFDDEEVPHNTLDQDNLGLVQGIPQDQYNMLPTPIMSTDPSPTDMEKEKELMKEKANAAMDELTRLLRLTEPFWFRSLVDQKLILQRRTYENTFHRTSHLQGSAHTRIESSKGSKTVSMGGKQLVNVFLIPKKWVSMFSTMVRKADTLCVFENGTPETRDGALILMNAEIHSFSPLVPTREFVFLRYCKQIGESAWTITDVSIGSSKHNNTLPNAWRFPSGCMIHEIATESSMVSWVEHVEVDDQYKTGQLFREAICKNDPFGAERWLMTLERMCIGRTSGADAGGVIRSPRVMKTIMQLGHRIMKQFCANLSEPSYMNTPQGGFSLSFRKNEEPGMLESVIITIVSSFWLPISLPNVFNFLRDYTRRDQWDVLCNAYPVCEIQRISSTAIHQPNNCTSILQPFILNETIWIVQESYMNSVESTVAYAPISAESLNLAAIRGEESSLLRFILPCGFTIVGDGRGNSTEEQGSLLTVALQVLGNTVSETGEVDIESLTRASKLMIHTVKRIKAGLNCSSLD